MNQAVLDLLLLADAMDITASKLTGDEQAEAVEVARQLRLKALRLASEEVDSTELKQMGSL